MGKILVIAEKPSVAADYAKALNQFNPKDGYYEGDTYVITWAIGHIVSRKELWEYDNNINRAAKNREHVLATVPYFPEKHILKLATINTELIKNDKGRLAMAKKNNDGLLKREQTLRELFARTDIDWIVNGCDSGREGEAIFWQIYEYLNCTFPVKRLWLSSNVAEDIVKEFKNLRPSENYTNLKEASYARAEMDWEHGLNLSVLYSSLYGAQLSVGRVQTPVTNMIVEREREINNFKAEDYYLLDANFSTKDNFKYKGRLIIDSSLGEIVEDGKIKNISKINEIMSRIEHKQGSIKSIEKNKKKESPKLLFNLSELQKEMSAKHRMSASEVLSIAQSLYETHKLTTYPRTSSQYLNTSMKDDVFERLDYLPPEYDSIVESAKASGCFLDKVLNDKKVEDHYALIPTTASRNYDFSKLSKKEMIVYTAILKRFISIFMPNHEYESTVLISTVDGYDFKTTGKKITQLGWKSLYSANKEEVDEAKEDDNNQDLTYNFTQGLTVLCDRTNVSSKKTQPPKRFTDGTLIGAMQVGGVKNIDIEDQDKLDALKEKGLGTEATRAGIIENIISRGYIERDKKAYLIPTQKGIEFIDRVSVDILKSPEITGEWEYQLKLVEKGELPKHSLISQVRQFIKNCVEEVKSSYKEGDRIINQNTIEATCPLCGGSIAKSPKAYFCTNSQIGCKFVIFPTICGKTIKDTDVKDICTKGSTKLIKGFKNPNRVGADGKPIKFDAKLVYDKENQKLVFGRPDGSIGAKERKETNYVCPRCGKSIMEFETGYGCSGYKDGCKFSFFKNLFSYKLTNDDINDLLTNGSTKVFNDLHNPKNPTRKFSAKLVLGDIAPEIVYMTDDNQEDTGKPTAYFCPGCSKPMLQFNRFYKCSSCSVSIVKTVAGVTLTEEQIKEICTDKKMSDCVDFTSNKGTTFRARLVFNPKNKKIEFQMDSKASEYTCPLCNSEIGERDTAYACTKCGLAVWKTIGNVKLKDTTIAEIFENKETSDYLELISAKGNPFKAKLVVNPKTKKVEFFFAPKAGR